MPRIADEFLECVVYVYPSTEDAEQARRVGGTGFLVSVPINDTGLSMKYVVTNSHVAVHARAVRLNTTDGRSDIVRLCVDQWIHHPAGDDIAITPIALSGRFRYRDLPPSWFLSEAKLAEWNVGPGDDVYFMGRFIAHDGKQQNQPVVRFGTIAMMPGEPVYQKERGFHQESFLIEARSLSGFSGSPVMLYVPPFSNRFKTGKFEDDGYGLQSVTCSGLLGIDWGNMHLGDEALTNSGIMAVVPAWKLHELLDDKEVVAMRRRAVEDMHEEAGGSMAELNTATEAEEFERFQSVLQRIVQVPKEEADEKRRPT